MIIKERLQRNLKETHFETNNIFLYRLNELEKLEKTVKDGSNREYHKLLENIEEKRAKMANVAEMRRSFAEGTVTNFYNAQKYAAYSQYHVMKF